MYPAKRGLLISAAVQHLIARDTKLTGLPSVSVLTMMHCTTLLPPINTIQATHDIVIVARLEPVFASMNACAARGKWTAVKSL